MRSIDDNPERVAALGATAIHLCHNPVGVVKHRSPLPRVARPSQPWALLRNPVGIRCRAELDILLSFHKSELTPCCPFSFDQPGFSGSDVPALVWPDCVGRPMSLPVRIEATSSKTSKRSCRDGSSTGVILP